MKKCAIARIAKDLKKSRGGGDESRRGGGEEKESRNEAGGEQQRRRKRRDEENKRWRKELNRAQYLSNPKPEHTSGGSGRRGARRGGGAGLDGVPTGRVAKKPTVPLAPRGIVNNCPQPLVASTNKGNPT